MRIYRKLIALRVVIAAAILAACSGASPAAISAAQAPTLEAESTATLPPTAGPSPTPTLTPPPTVTLTPTITPTPTHPLMIEVMRQQDYPGSDLVFEQTLDPGANYSRSIVSYLSEGYKIYALLTIPSGERPAAGWPVIIFNHGFIPPDEYRTTERYVAYVDTFARHGYIVLKSDYRGHGDSEGRAAGGYGSPAYTADVLNAVGSIQRYPDADSSRIGMWGHSMGGHVTLRAMVVSRDIKAGVIWGGVVGSYPDLFEHWWGPRDANRPSPTPNPASTRGRWRGQLIETYGTPEENPAFWASISPNTYLRDISGPLQLHHATGDASVPVILSEILYDQMTALGLPVELYLYEGDNHNISAHFDEAMARSVMFFDVYVKGS